MHTIIVLSKYFEQMSTSDLVSGVLVPVILSVLTTLITLYISYRSRRRLTMTSTLRDENIYHSFYASEFDYQNLFSGNDTKLKTSTHWPKNFRILELIVSNESSKPIYIQSLRIYDKEKEIKLANKFDLESINKKVFKNDEVVIISSKILGGNNTIHLQKINLFQADTIVLKPYESLILVYALDSEICQVRIKAYTTIARNRLMILFGVVFNKVRNFLQIETKEYTYKTFYTKARGKELSI